MVFIPEKPASPKLDVPFFEDSKDEKIPGRRTSKSTETLQAEITDLMLRLGAGAVRFTPGTFPGDVKRYGFQVTFSMNGTPGRIELAALPLRNEAPAKKEQALAQALYLFRNWLEAEVWSAVYRPGAIALLPFLVADNGKTITEITVERGLVPEMSQYWLPALGSGS